MTVYEMIQELTEFPADAEVRICVEGQDVFEEVDTGKAVCIDIERTSSDIGGSYERGGKCYFDVTI